MIWAGLLMTTIPGILVRRTVTKAASGILNTQVLNPRLQYWYLRKRVADPVQEGSSHYLLVVRHPHANLVFRWDRHDHSPSSRSTSCRTQRLGACY
ncbi:hypothetical protein EV401DRAFT_1989625, partial [Pisolithus croceorrhizus]